MLKHCCHGIDRQSAGDQQPVQDPESGFHSEGKRGRIKTHIRHQQWRWRLREAGILHPHERGMRTYRCRYVQTNYQRIKNLYQGS